MNKKIWIVISISFAIAGFLTGYQYGLFEAFFLFAIGFGLTLPVLLSKPVLAILFIKPCNIHMKPLIRSTYVWLIVFGIAMGPIGMLMKLPIVAALGNAMFIAGFLTPVLFTRKITKKDAIFGGIWLSTVLYFAQNGEIQPTWLLLCIPLLQLSGAISKYAGATFVAKD